MRTDCSRAKGREISRSVLSALLSFAMAFSSVPAVPVYADEPADSSISSEQVEQAEGQSDSSAFDKECESDVELEDEATNNDGEPVEDAVGNDELATGSDVEETPDSAFSENQGASEAQDLANAADAYEDVSATPKQDGVIQPVDSATPSSDAGSSNNEAGGESSQNNETLEQEVFFQFADKNTVDPSNISIEITTADNDLKAQLEGAALQVSSIQASDELEIVSQLLKTTT